MQSLEAFLSNEGKSPLKVEAKRDPRTGNVIMTLTGGDHGKQATFVVVGNAVMPVPAE